MSEPVGNGPRGGPSSIPAITGNSHKTRAEAPQTPPPMEKVITGKVVVRKPSFLSRFKKSFVADDARTVGDYLVDDVFIPEMRRLAYALVVGGAGVVLFGRRGHATPGPANYRQNPVSNIMGGGLRNKYEGLTEGPVRNQLPQQTRTLHDFEALALESPEEARMAISSLISRCQTYGQATVVDLYNALGVSSSYADLNFGWTDLNEANTGWRQVPGGFVLTLPKPQPFR